MDFKLLYNEISVLYKTETGSEPDEIRLEDNGTFQAYQFDRDGCSCFEKSYSFEYIKTADLEDMAKEKIRKDEEERIKKEEERKQREEMNRIHAEQKEKSEYLRLKKKFENEKGF